MPAKWRLASPIAAMGTQPSCSAGLWTSPYYKTGRPAVQAKWSFLFNS